ncbi:hypothetical protein CNR22_14085 [Sphingobacteriaceae bacterium]|nr:hypothetical protein CNR22_14085 [Sphingobacteriaceae bacterium]
MKKEMVFSMTQYNSLQLYQKAVVLGDEAVFLMTLEKNDIIYALYSFCGFYIEVLLDQEDKRLIDIIAFRQLKTMDKYLDNITLVGF